MKVPTLMTLLHVEAKCNLPDLTTANEKHEKNKNNVHLIELYGRNLRTNIRFVFYTHAKPTVLYLELCAKFYFIFTMYIVTVHCTLCIVHYTLYIVHYTLYTVHCTLHFVHCTLYITHHTRPFRVKCVQHLCTNC